MQQNTSLSLPKWPFYVGNLLLVATAIVLAFQGGTQLSTAQFFWCFLCVGLGAVIFAAPYVIEYRTDAEMKSQSGKQGMSAPSGKQLQAIEASLNSIKAMNEKLANQASKQGLSQTMVDSVIQNLDARFTALTESLSGYEKLATELQKLNKLPETLSKAQANGTTPETQKQLDTMSDQMTMVLEQLSEQSDTIAQAGKAQDNSQMQKTLDKLADNMTLLTAQVQNLSTEIKEMAQAQQAAPQHKEQASARAPMAENTQAKGPEAPAPTQERAANTTAMSINELLTETHNIVHDAGQEGSAPTQQNSNNKTAASQAAPAPSDQPLSLDDLVAKSLSSSEDLMLMPEDNADSSMGASMNMSSQEPSMQQPFAQEQAMFDLNAANQAQNAIMNVLEEPAAAPQSTVTEIQEVAPCEIAQASETMDHMEQLLQGELGAQEETALAAQENQMTQEQSATQQEATEEIQIAQAEAPAPANEEPALEEETQQEVTYAEAVGTSLIVHALTGIGKKPFVRGQGPGLSWTEGSPMEFIETGKWQWTSSDSSQPVVLRVYKDDEVPAEGEVIAIQPGEQLEITPSFKG